jgi:ABC-type transporter Mla subunit MlaD
VRLQGVKIGEVRDVALDPNTQKPIITIAVKPHKLLKNYQYSIRTNSLIGEPYVDIRGPYDPAGTQVAYVPNDPEQPIGGTSATDIADLTQQATDISGDFRVTLQKLNVTIDRINKGVLSYENQVRLTRALESVTRLSTEASKSFGNQGVKISFGDPRAQASLNRTLENTARAAQEAGVAARTVSSNVNSLSGNINALSGNLNGTLAENRGQVRGLLQNLSATARNVSGLTESLTFVVRQSGFAENSQLAFRSLRRAAENVEASTAGFRTLSNDPKTQQNLRDTVDALRVTTESLRDIATTISKTVDDPGTQAGLRSALVNINATTANVEKATANLAEVTGGFKNIVGDPQLQRDLKETANNLNGTLAATRAAAERVNSLLGGRNPRRVRTREDGITPDTTTPDGRPGDGQRRRNRNRNKEGDDEKVTQASTLPSGVDFTFRHLSDAEQRRRDRDDVARNFGDLTFNAELFGSPVRAGISGIGEGNDLTLQSGNYIGRNGVVRYGLYRSKLGVGAQYNLGRFRSKATCTTPIGVPATSTAEFRLRLR